MRKQIPVPLETSDEFRLVADHGKFLIAFDIDDNEYHVWAKAPRRRDYKGLKYRGIVWGIAAREQDSAIFSTLVRAEQYVCSLLRAEGSWQ